MFRLDEFVKIWFSTPDGHPLGGPLNEYRLWSHRLRFPKDKINLISNFESFPEEKQIYIRNFCTRWNINLISLSAVEQEIMESQQAIQETLDQYKVKLGHEKKKHRKATLQENISTCEEKLSDIQNQIELLKFAKLEITEDYRCLAAASDIVRILSPIARRGIYTDFDVVKLKNNRTHLKSHLGLLLDGYFGPENADQLVYNQLCNNNFCVDESQTNFLRIYRAHMLKMYTDKKAVNELLKTIIRKNIFIADEYNAAIAHLKDEKASLQNLPYALQIRTVLKIHVNEQCYEKFLKDFVLDISGPGCMHDAFEVYFNEEFVPYCQNRKIFENRMIKQFQKFRLDYGFTNEDDVSWLKSESQTKKRYDRVESAAVTI